MCSAPNCFETTRRGMRTALCWKNKLCPTHAVQAGLYKRNYDIDLMPFRKRTRPYT